LKTFSYIEEINSLSVLKYTGKRLAEFKQMLNIPRMKFLVLNFLFSIVSLLSFGGELTIKGVYQGKNVYVQNPYNVEQKEFCTEEVYLNNVKVLSSIRNSAFTINLSNLEIGTPVEIRIKYKADCSPKVVNAYVLQSNSKYTFENLAIVDKEINWELKEDVLGGRFIIEKYTENYWKPISTSQIILNQKQYKVAVAQYFTNGTNKFRVKYLSPTEEVSISNNLDYEVMDENAILSLDASNKIRLSKEASYEIIDEDGNKIQDGKGREIGIANLDPGVYYINYENKSEKFLKK
jgi:hypothetical protein